MLSSPLWVFYRNLFAVAPNLHIQLYACRYCSQAHLLADLCACISLLPVFSALPPALGASVYLTQPVFIHPIGCCRRFEVGDHSIPFSTLKHQLHWLPIVRYDTWSPTLFRWFIPDGLSLVTLALLGLQYCYPLACPFSPCFKTF